MDVARIVVFVAVTIGLAYVSKGALRSPASHGFPRFFAWEAILMLLLLNFVDSREWFRDSLSARQVASWILLTSSFVLLVLGVHLLTARGRPDANARADEALFGLEKTTADGRLDSGPSSRPRRRTQWA